MPNAEPPPHTPDCQAELERLRQDFDALRHEHAQLQRLRYAESNLARFSNLLRWDGHDELGTWTERLLAEFVPFAGALQAALYVCDDADGAPALHLAGGYACGANVPRTIAFGHGITGQVAASRDAREFDFAATDARVVAGALAQVQPQALRILPLVYNQVLEGVLELSAAHAFSDEARSLTDAFAAQLAASLGAVRSQLHIRRLLRDSQAKSDLLVAAEEETRQNMEELEATQEELRRLQHQLQVQLRGTLDALDRSNAVIEFATDGTILRANEQFLRVAGYVAADIVGKHHRVLVAPEVAISDAYQDMWRRLREGEPLQGEFERVRANGQPFFVLGSYSPVFYADGSIDRIIKIVVDVTEARQARQALQLAHEEMQAQQEELNANLDALQAAYDHQAAAQQQLQAALDDARFSEEELRNSESRYRRYIEELLTKIQVLEADNARRKQPRKTPIAA